MPSPTPTTGPAAATRYDPLFWMQSPGNTPKAGRRDFHDPADTPWTDWLMPGTRYKLLYCNLVSGAFTILLQVDPGVQATSHWHVGNLQVYILEGGFHYYDGLVEIDGELVPDRARRTRSRSRQPAPSTSRSRATKAASCSRSSTDRWAATPRTAGSP